MVCLAITLAGCSFNLLKKGNTPKGKVEPIINNIVTTSEKMATTTSENISAVSIIKNGESNTYINNIWNFKFQYPSSYKAEYVTSTNLVNVDFSKGIEAFTLDLRKETDKFYRDDYLDMKFNPNFDKETVINGLEVIKFVRPCGDCVCNTEADVKKFAAITNPNEPGFFCKTLTVTYRFFSPDNIYYTITFFKDARFKTEQDALEKQVVSTFALIDNKY